MRCLHALCFIFIVALFSFNSINADKDSENVEEKTSPAATVSCDNRLTAYTVSENTRLVSSSSLVYEDIAEEVCLTICSSNRDYSGRAILCASAVYDHAVFVCTIFQSKTFPEGELKTEFAPGQRLFEKFCLKKPLIECADIRFLKVEQSVITGYAKNVSLVRSIEECIEQCLTEHFQCRSAMYFYAEGECITNTESAMTQPASFTREENDKVIYIQNGCPAILARQRQFQNSTTAATGAAEDHGDVDVDDKAKTTSLMTETAIKNDYRKVITGEMETTNRVANTAFNSSNKDRVHANNYEESLRKFVPVEEATAASTVKEMSRMLKQNLKKLKISSGTISTSKLPKVLKQTKLEQIKKELRSKESAKNHMEKSLPSKVRPSLSPVENHHTERTNSVLLLIHKKDEVQKPTKRLKIVTLNGFKDERHFSQWSNWSPCRRPNERSIRRRKCYNLQKCVGALMEVRKCPKVVKEELEFKVKNELVSKVIEQMTNQFNQNMYSIATPDGSGLRTSSDNNQPLAPVLSGGPILTNKTDDKTGIPFGIPHRLRKSHSEKESKEKANEKIWSPWQGICQKFSSGYPCKNHEIIGFESRDCLATDRAKCKGPFFRYCTIPC